MDGLKTLSLRNGAISALVAVVALTSAYGLSLSLRHSASQRSHQQPTPEAWFEVPSASSAALISQGRTLFLSSCARCHASDATGDEGPDLHNVQVSDRYISRIIIRGIKGEMPSFKKKLGGDDILRLTRYLRSLD